jgi:fatty acid desaturase
VHRSIGLGGRGTEWALFLCGLTLLESGHAYRATHLQHHRRFPLDDDPEGYPAKISAVGAVLYGPVFLARLWWWAFRRVKGDRAWLVAEASALPMATAAGVLLWPRTPALLGYVVMAVVGSWVYPLLTVHLPHDQHGDSPLTQTRTIRGRVLPAVFLELTYHLEHHLYPQVPSHHLAELGRRLDPYLAANGVRPITMRW